MRKQRKNPFKVGQIVKFTKDRIDGGTGEVVFRKGQSFEITRLDDRLQDVVYLNIPPHQQYYSQGSLYKWSERRFYVEELTKVTRKPYAQLSEENKTYEQHYETLTNRIVELENLLVQSYYEQKSLAERLKYATNERERERAERYEQEAINRQRHQHIQNLEFYARWGAPLGSVYSQEKLAQEVMEYRLKNNIDLKSTSTRSKIPWPGWNWD